MGTALKTERNTPEMEKRVAAAAAKKFDLEPNETLFEHGQWWVKFWPEGDASDVALYELTFGSDSDEETFSVVDAAGPGAVDGFDFERV